MTQLTNSAGQIPAPNITKGCLVDGAKIVLETTSAITGQDIIGVMSSTEHISNPRILNGTGLMLGLRRIGAAAEALITSGMVSRKSIPAGATPISEEPIKRRFSDITIRDLNADGTADLYFQVMQAPEETLPNGSSFTNFFSSESSSSAVFGFQDLQRTTETICAP